MTRQRYHKKLTYIKFKLAEYCKANNIELSKNYYKVVAGPTCKFDFTAYKSYEEAWNSKEMTDLRKMIGA